MTEEEAKTKWCFHFIASHTDPRTPPSQYEREDGMASPFRHHCIASACMAWRWRLSPTAAAAAWEPTDADGYCGLAGAPQ